MDRDKAVLSAIKGDVRINDAYLPSGSFEFPFIGSLHMGAEGLDSDLNAVLSGTPLNFSLGIRQWSDPHWQFALQADVLDLDKLFPPEAKAQAAPTPPGKPAAAPAAAAPPAQAPAANSFKWLQGLAMTGKIDIGQLKGRELEARQVKAKVLAGDGELVLDGLSAQLYEGTLTGRFSVDVKSAMTARLSLKGVEADAFSRLSGLSYSLTGKTNFDADLKTQGGNLAEDISQLAGSVKLRIQPGTIRGLDLEAVLSDPVQTAQAALAGQSMQSLMRVGPNSQTPFSSLQIDAAIKQGVADVRQFALQAPLFQVTQSKRGTVNLPGNWLDMQLDVRVLKGLTVPLAVNGPLNQPDYQLQWNKLGGKLGVQALERGVLDALSSGRAGVSEVLNEAGSALKP
jgi:AsmA protein